MKEIFFLILAGAAIVSVVQESIRFKNKLSKTNWQNILVSCNANDDYNAFVKKFNDLYDECIPLNKCTGKQ